MPRFPNSITPASLDHHKVPSKCIRSWPRPRASRTRSGIGVFGGSGLVVEGPEVSSQTSQIWHWFKCIGYKSSLGSSWRPVWLWEFIWGKLRRNLREQSIFSTYLFLKNKNLVSCEFLFHFHQRCWTAGHRGHMSNCERDRRHPHKQSVLWNIANNVV
jgi:hypothetical protein